MTGLTPHLPNMAWNQGQHITKLSWPNGTELWKTTPEMDMMTGLTVNQARVEEHWWKKSNSPSPQMDSRDGRPKEPAENKVAKREEG